MLLFHQHISRTWSYVNRHPLLCRVNVTRYSVGDGHSLGRKNTCNIVLDSPSLAYLRYQPHIIINLVKDLQHFAIVVKDAPKPTETIIPSSASRASVLVTYEHWIPLVLPSWFSPPGWVWLRRGHGCLKVFQMYAAGAVPRSAKTKTLAASLGYN